MENTFKFTYSDTLLNWSQKAAFVSGRKGQYLCRSYCLMINLLCIQEKSEGSQMKTSMLSSVEVADKLTKEASPLEQDSGEEFHQQWEESLKSEHVQAAATKGQYDLNISKRKSVSLES